MIDNDYTSLYDAFYYEMKLYYMTSDTSNKEFREFLSNMALANAVYVESKKCFSIVDNQVHFDKESNVIYLILETYPHIYDVLKDAMEIEKITYINGNVTYLQAAVIVCDEHLKKMSKVIHK